MFSIPARPHARLKHLSRAAGSMGKTSPCAAPERAARAEIARLERGTQRELPFFVSGR